MNSVRFDNLAGLLFLIFPLSVLIIYVLSGKIFKKGVYLSGVNKIHFRPSIKVILHYVSVAFVIGGLFIMALSLTKPQYGIKKEKIEFTGIDIMITLDVSPSMLTNDYVGYTRIDVAKSIINDFVTRRKGDRIGMITFSTDSMIKSPATTNYDLLRRIISKIYIDPDKPGSTSIGVGMASGINRLTKLNDNSVNTSKILILVTDGRSNSGEITPQAATEIARKLGIKVYTIGIGTNEEVDSELMKNISVTTGGQFYHARNAKELNFAFSDIDRIEKQKLETVEYKRYNNAGFPVAFIGIVIFIIGIISYSFLFRRLG